MMPKAPHRVYKDRITWRQSVGEPALRRKLTRENRLATLVANKLANKEEPMGTRTVSATEAKNRFGAVVKSAREADDVVLVENHGEPYVFMLPPAEFKRLQDADRELQRKNRLERLEEIMQRQAELNQDLSAEAADELAVRAVREYRASQRQHPDRA